MSEVVNKAKARAKYRRPLNDRQLRVLGWLIKMRFSTSKQIATHLGKSYHKAIQSKLQILEAQELIGKRYDKSYKLAGRAAEYYVTPKGARMFATARDMTIHPNAMKALYKNKTVSSDFLLHCVHVADTVLKLRAVYDAKKLLIHSPNELRHTDYLPEWSPDLFMGYKTSDAAHYAFLDVWDGSKPFFVTVRKTRNYVNFKDSGDWQEDAPFPAILAVCEDSYVQKKLNRQMKRILTDTWDDDLIFATTTKQQLYQATKPTDKIWLKIEMDGDPGKATLRSLFVV